MPPFENVVANKLVEVSPEEKTCGARVQSDYCIQTHGIYRECHTCTADGAGETEMHPPKYLTDVEQSDLAEEQTHWQSVTMLEDVHTQDINLTVNLGKLLLFYGKYGCMVRSICTVRERSLIT